MVVVRRRVSRFKGHIDAILEAFKEILRPKTITVQYPREIRRYDYIRGYLEFDVSLCLGCARCARICPANAIRMVKKNGKFYPSIDYGKCIFCHFCVDVCPTNALKNTSIHDLSFESYDVKMEPGFSVRRRSIPEVEYVFEGDVKLRKR